MLSSARAMAWTVMLSEAVRSAMLALPDTREAGGGHVLELQADPSGGTPSPTEPEAFGASLAL